MKRRSWIWILLCAALVAAPGAADSRAELKKGLAAADFNRWQEAAGYFRAAIAEDAQESAQQVFVSGVFSAPYLPHFQLGQALYRLDPSTGCAEAVDAWDESLRQGVVRGFKRHLKELESDRAECLRRLIPSRKRSLADLRGRLRDMVEPLLDDTLTGAELSASLVDERDALGTAWRRFEAAAEQALGADDAVALQTTLDVGRALEPQAASLGRSLASRRRESLAAARSQALRTVIDAEAAHTSLGASAEFQPHLDADQRRAYSQQAQILGELRTRLEGAADEASVTAVAAAASAAGRLFDELRSVVAEKRRQPRDPAVGTSPALGASPSRNGGGSAIESSRRSRTSRASRLPSSWAWARGNVSQPARGRSRSRGACVSQRRCRFRWIMRSRGSISVLPGRGGDAPG